MDLKKHSEYSGLRSIQIVEFSTNQNAAKLEFLESSSADLFFIYRGG